MARTYSVVISRVPQAIAYVNAAASSAVDESIKFGAEEAKRRLTPGHGVDTGATKASITSHKTGKHSGEIVNPTFPPGRYLEYGTTFMAAIPHMRPAARLMGVKFGKELRDKLGRFR